MRWWFGGALLLLPSLGSGQPVIKGNVSDQKKQPIVGAELLIEEVVRARSGPAGEWEIELSAAGIVTVTARAIGYYPAARRMLVAAGDSVIVRLVLEPTGQTLDSVTVVAPAPRVSAKMQAFEERRRGGFGRFLTRTMLAEREHSTLESSLRMVAGVRLLRRPIVCGGGMSAASGRGGSIRARCTNGALFPSGCYLAIYLDGARIWAPGTPEPPDVNQFAISTLEGVEIYRGGSETPAQYQGTNNACGALLLWTRTGES